MSISCVLSKDSQLLEEIIKNSEKFLKIVTFRFFSEDFANILIKKAKSGVDVEVITTPADSVAKEEMRPQVERMYKTLRDKNVKLFTCSWEAGEPRLTSTSMSGRLAAGIGEKWYSIHLQLIVNEKQALITSKNLTSDRNLDIYFLNSTPQFVKLALDKFGKIKEIFFEPVKLKNITITGKIINFLDEEILKETINLFDQSKRLNVKHYNLRKLPDANLKNGIFICPFEGRLRDFLYKFIDSSNSFLYFFVETFFDEALVEKLEEKINAFPDIKIKIITSPPERIRQNRPKARNLINQVLSLGINVGYLPDIQAKFWVSDKWLAVPSGDFNKMNLGHKSGKNYWKADTQLILLDNDEDLVRSFKNLFEQYFEPIDIGSISIKDVKSLFVRLTKRHRMQSTDEAKNYVARLKSSLIIKTEKDTKYVIDLAIRLAKFHGKRKVEGLFAIMAIILYYLQRREHKLQEIIEKLENVTDESKIKDAITRLQFQGFIMKSEDMYRVNVKKILP